MEEVERRESALTRRWPARVTVTRVPCRALLHCIGIGRCHEGEQRARLVGHARGRADGGLKHGQRLNLARQRPEYVDAFDTDQLAHLLKA